MTGGAVLVSVVRAMLVALVCVALFAGLVWLGLSLTAGNGSSPRAAAEPVGRARGSHHPCRHVIAGPALSLGLGTPRRALRTAEAGVSPFFALDGTGGVRMPLPPKGQWREDSAGSSSVVTQLDHIARGHIDWTAYIVRSGPGKSPGWVYAGGGPGALGHWDSLPYCDH